MKVLSDPYVLGLCLKGRLPVSYLTVTVMRQVWLVFIKLTSGIFFIGDWITGVVLHHSKVRLGLEFWHVARASLSCPFSPIPASFAWLIFQRFFSGLPEKDFSFFFFLFFFDVHCLIQVVPLTVIPPAGSLPVVSVYLCASGTEN